MSDEMLHPRWADPTPAVTPVEERIDHEEAKRVATTNKDSTQFPVRVVSRAYLALLTEHFAREQRIAYFVNLYPSFKDYFRDHFLPATEPAQPEEER